MVSGPQIEKLQDCSVLVCVRIAVILYLPDGHSIVYILLNPESKSNCVVLFQDFKVDTFEYRLLREVEFRESLTRRYVGEIDAQIVTTVDRSLGPVAPPQIAQKPRNSKLAEGSDAIFQAKVTANPKPRVSMLLQAVYLLF